MRRVMPMETLQRVRVYLTRPAVWVVVGYIGLFVVFILGGVVYTREANDRAARSARIQVRYEQCLASVPFTQKINRFILGVKTVGGVLLLNSVQMHAVTPPGSAAYRQQEVNLKRLRHALNDQRAITAFPVPTPASCRTEVGLSVDPPATSSG